ncbi:MAG: GNAT family N-acetyltransferase [Thermoguttaceae bacterium]|nr:GNAT family N-acetyltransferase [Thermoguttaceae bacterium]
MINEELSTNENSSLNQDSPRGPRLIRPAPEYLLSYYQACQETWGQIHDSYILHDPALFHQWKETIFDDYRRHEKGEDLPEGHVPSATFWAAEGNQVIGAVNIRLELNDFLRTYGGQIGCFVRLSYRGRGYFKRILPLALQTARQLGIEGEIPICCLASNTPSRRGLLCGDYRRRDRIEVEYNGQKQEVCRFFF